MLACLPACLLACLLVGRAVASMSFFMQGHPVGKRQPAQPSHPTGELWARDIVETGKGERKEGEKVVQPDRSLRRFFFVYLAGQPFSFRLLVRKDTCKIIR